MKIISFVLFFVSIIFMNGCAQKQAMLKADTLVAHGFYKDAATFTDSKIDKDDLYAKDNLLWSLQSGVSYFYASDNNASIKHFNDSEAIMKHYRQQILIKDINQTLKSTLLNDRTRPYIGTVYDGIMANTYKAISYMALEDTDGARV